jgi:hypothetical protein
MSEQPVDLGAVARDDALLDALGRGDDLPPDDEFAAMLASWRTDLSPDEAADDAEEEMATPPLVQKTAHSRLARFVLAAAAVVLAAAGTVAIAAGRAQPGGRLWPITTVVYAERADSLVAAQDARSAIAEAREAVAADRYAEADRLLDQATALAGRVVDTGTRQELLDEVAAVRALLPGATPSTTTSRAPTPTPSASPSSSAGSGSHAGSGTTGNGNSGSTPSPSASSGGSLTDILPDLPLPTITLIPKL